MELVTPGTGLIFWQFIVFLLVLIILRAFAWKPILSSLKAREDTIAEALEKAEMARQQTENLKADNEKLLQEARLEREKVLKDALSASDKIRQEAKNDALKISEKMINDAKIAIETEKNTALQEVKKLVADLSLEIAEKLLKKNLSDQKSQKDLVNNLLKDINRN